MPTKRDIVQEIMELMGPDVPASKSSLLRNRKDDLLSLLDEARSYAGGVDDIPLAGADRPYGAGRGGQLLFDFGEVDARGPDLGRPIRSVEVGPGGALRGAPGESDYLPWSQRQLPDQLDLDYEGAAVERQAERKRAARARSRKKDLLRGVKARSRAFRMKHPLLSKLGRGGLAGLGYLGIALEAQHMANVAGAVSPRKKDKLADLLELLATPDPQVLEMADLQRQARGLRLAEASAEGAAAGRAIRESVPAELQFLMNTSDEATLRKAAVDGTMPSLYEVAAKSGLV